VLDDPRVFEFRTTGQIIAALHAVPAEQKKSTDVVVLQLHKFATDDLLEALHGFGHVFNLVITEKDLKFAVERGANGAWVPVHFTPLSVDELNLSFERGDKTIDGWYTSGAGHDVGPAATAAHSGKRGLRFAASTRPPAPPPPCTLKKLPNS
jgi:hypothetical protein